MERKERRDGGKGKGKAKAYDKGFWCSSGGLGESGI